MKLGLATIGGKASFSTPVRDILDRVVRPLLPIAKEYTVSNHPSSSFTEKNRDRSILLK